MIQSPPNPRPVRRAMSSLEHAGVAVLILALAAGPALAESPKVLFIRGADRSGGFLTGGSDEIRNEQLADITNASTADGNHGWKEFAELLRSVGYDVEQVTETPETPTGLADGLPVPLEQMDLSAYDVLVFGSNNATYGTAAVDAVEQYLRTGGAAVFMSDADFGSDWADAADSDQHFLDCFGLVMHQDHGRYARRRSSGHFLAPDHPILAGVDEFKGEGVSPIRVEAAAPGVDVTVLVEANDTTRLNEPPFDNERQGPLRAVETGDAALLAATVDAGRLVGYFDRNTFFNLNGAGTDLHQFEHRQLAINLFDWLADLALIPGDHNRNRQVEQGDLDLVLQNWGVDTDNAGMPAGWFGMPATGVIDQTELDQVLQNWGATSSPISTNLVPSPEALGLGVALILLRRSSNRHAETPPLLPELRTRSRSG